MSVAAMTEPIAEAQRFSTANIARAFYLASILTAGAAAFVRWRLTGDAAATATNILTHQQLFWMVLAADLISILCYVAVTLLFYEMFKPVSKHLFFLTASFSFLACAIAVFADLFHAAAFVVLRGAQYLHILDLEPLRGLELLLLTLRAQTYNISLVFFGLSCLLMVYIIFKSAFLPRLVGAIK